MTQTQQLLDKYVVKRRSVSVSGPLYARLHGSTDGSLQKIVDGLIVSALDDAMVSTHIVATVRARAAARAARRSRPRS